MTSTDRRLRHKQEVRQHILDVAKKIGIEEGWDKVTMRRIATAIGYSLPVIYTHFKDETTLYDTLASELFGSILNECLKSASRRKITFINLVTNRNQHFELIFLSPKVSLECRSKLLIGIRDIFGLDTLEKALSKYLLFKYKVSDCNEKIT
jgi:AcrR family transcriptional regulator